MAAPTYTLEVAFAAPPSLNYAAEVLADSPNGYWRLDDLTDTVAKAGTLTENAGPISSAASLLTTDTVSVSRDLNGTTQYYTAADSAYVDVGDVFTLEAWIRPDNVSSRSIFSRGANGYQLRLTSGGALQLSKEGTSGIVASTVALSASGVTYHVVATKNGATVKLYLNGVDVTGTVTNATIADTATALNIGRISSGGEFFDGWIDEIAIYPTALSQARVTAHFEAGNPTWTNLSPYMQAFHTKHGKQRELGVSDAGTCTIRLNNADRRFDPSHTASPYYPYVRPRRLIRLRAVHNAVTYGLFRGVVQSWPQEDDGPTSGFSTIDCVDGFLLLAKADVGEGEVWPMEYGGERIARILDAAGWNPSLRDLDTGRSLISEMSIQLGSGITALAAILEVADAELGSFFIDADGVACFHDRHRRRGSSYLTAAATFGDANTAGLPYKLVTRDTDDDGIANDVQVTAADGDTQRAQDTDSQTEFGRSTIARSIPLARVTEAADQAAWLLEQNKEPRDVLRTIEFAPAISDALWVQALSRDISDHVIVNRWPQKVGATITQHCSIEAVEHSWTPGGVREAKHATKWMLSTPAPSAVDWWILGDSTYGVLGSTTKVIY